MHVCAIVRMDDAGVLIGLVRCRVGAEAEAADIKASQTALADLPSPCLVGLDGTPKSL